MLIFVSMLELGSILILGIFAQWLAWKVKLPAILPLILIGLLAGPLSQLFFGEKMIDPQEIFAGRTMYYFVSLAVGIILFEGGITLKFKEVREVATTVRNLIFYGAVIMLIGGAFAAWWLLDMDYRLALLFGALIIVTGPTVISPLIKTVKPNNRIATVLKWEGILIDPVGALVAVLIYELLFVAALGAEGNVTIVAIKTFAYTILVGSGVGALFGTGLYFILKKEWIPDFLLELVTLAVVIGAYTLSDYIHVESGLLAVTVMGVLIANINTPKLDKIIDFKESITILLISILFIILSANIDVSQLKLLGWSSLGVFLVVVFILRPVSVFLSSRKSNLTFNEKLFISWIGPKGIVAASIAAVFSLYLTEDKMLHLPIEIQQQVPLLVPLTFSIILGTVILNGVTAKLAAKWLGVQKKLSGGYLIIGGNDIALAIAKYLKSRQISVLIVDSSQRNVRNALKNGIPAIQGNVLSEEVDERIEIEDVGNVLALTSANDINILACRKFSKLFGSEHTYRLITSNEIHIAASERPANILFGENADYLKLAEIIRKYPHTKELELTNQEQLTEIIESGNKNVVPLFIYSKKQTISPVDIQGTISASPGDILVYLGDLSAYEENSSSV